MGSRRLKIAAILIAALGFSACTSTKPEDSASAPYHEDTKELPSFEQMGIDDGTNGQQWDNYSTTVPFQSEAHRSTEVKGLSQTASRKGASRTYVAQNRVTGTRKKK
jgi:hypothetical protein